jgi:type II secretory pathway pseudopilin PulG
MAPQVRELPRELTREVPLPAERPAREQAAESAPPAAAAGPSKWVSVVGWTLVGGCVAIVAIAVLAAPRMPRNARAMAYESACSNNCRNIQFALRMYAQSKGHLPPARTLAPDGTPLHSWRTLILPYLGPYISDQERRVFEMIDLTKPWNDPANAAALATPMPVYTCAEQHGGPSGLRTHYQVVVSDAGLFRPDGSAKAWELTDEAILFVHVPRNHDVHWMEPRDLDEATFVGLPLPLDSHDSRTLLTMPFSSTWIKRPEETSPAARRAYVTTAKDGPGISP